MMLLALMLQAAAPPRVPTPTPPADLEGSTVVVVGRPLSETRAALEACLKRHCPPAEEIAAATAHGVNQFLAGDYEGSRATLNHAAGRNKKYAAELPGPVSDLLQLHGALASLTGYSETGRIRTQDAVDALRKGLPAGDPRIGVAELTVAASFAQQGRFYDAIGLFDGTAARAAAAHQPAVQGKAMLDAAMLYAGAAEVDASYSDEARKRIAAINATTDPALQSYRDATVALRGRLASRAGNKRELDAVLAEAATMRSHEALLITDPVIDSQDLYGSGTAQDPIVVGTRDQWANIAYRVAPDGSVRDIEVAQTGPGADKRWIKAVTAAVAKRHYLPLDLPANSPGLARLVRFSLVANYGYLTRSHIRQQVGAPHLQITDLTPQTAAPASGA